VEVAKLQDVESWFFSSLWHPLCYLL